MATINRVILVGYVGADPEAKETTGGVPMTVFRVATTESWKDPSGARQERTEWHNVVGYDKLAEIANKYVTKGALVYVEGQIVTHSWKDKEDRVRSATDIKAREIRLLGARKASEEPKGPF